MIYRSLSTKGRASGIAKIARTYPRSMRPLWASVMAMLERSWVIQHNEVRDARDEVFAAATELIWRLVA